MSKDSEFKYKDNEQKLVESQPEVLEAAEEGAKGNVDNAGADETDSAVPEDPGEVGREAEAAKTSNNSASTLQISAPSNPNKKPPSNRPQTAKMVLTLGCVFVAVLLTASSSIRIGRASIRAQIGALFGASSNQSIDSSLDLVEALYQKAAYDPKRSHHLGDLDAALARTVTNMESTGVRDMRLALLKLRQSTSAVWRGDKAAASSLVGEAMQLIPQQPPALFEGVPHNLKNAMAEAGYRLASAREYKAALPLLEARLAYKGPTHECLERVRERLGDCYLNQGDYKRAFACYQQAFDDAKGPCGGHDPESMRRKASMGLAKAKMHEYKEAAGYFQEAFSFYKTHYKGAGLYGGLEFVADYADVQMALGDYDGAKKLLTDSMNELKQSKAKLGYCAKALMSLARYYKHANQPQEGLKLLDQVIEEIQKGSPVPLLEEVTQLRDSFGVK